MRHVHAAIAALVLAALWGPAALALPAPKTEAELMQLADLVVDAQCVTVRCEGAPKNDGTKIITAYRSTLFPSKTYKGGLPNSLDIIGEEWQYLGPPPVGGWHQEAVKKGWAGKLYLKKATGGTYTKVWWNAMTEDTSRSKPVALPSCAAAGDGGPPTPDAAPPIPDAGPGKPDAMPPPCDMNFPEGPPAMGDDPVWIRDAVMPDAPSPTADSGPAADAAKSPDTGFAPSGTSDDGCSVGAAGGSAPSGSMLGIAILAALALRRRRR